MGGWLELVREAGSISFLLLPLCMMSLLGAGVSAVASALGTRPPAALWWAAPAFLVAVGELGTALGALEVAEALPFVAEESLVQLKLAGDGLARASRVLGYGMAALALSLSAFGAAAGGLFRLGAARWATLSAAGALTPGLLTAVGLVGWGASTRQELIWLWGAVAAGAVAMGLVSLRRGEGDDSAQIQAAARARVAGLWLGAVLAATLATRNENLYAIIRHLQVAAPETRVELLAFAKQKEALVMGQGAVALLGVALGSAAGLAPVGRALFRREALLGAALVGAVLLIPLGAAALSSWGLHAVDAPSLEEMLNEERLAPQRAGDESPLNN